MRWLIRFVAIGMLGAWSSCQSSETAGSGPAMKKVRPEGAGLPAANPGPGAPVRSSAPATTAMPDDEVHRRARAGRQGVPPEGFEPRPEAVAGTSHGVPAAPEELDGHDLPLKKKGLGSAEELAAALARIQTEEARRRFEQGFRWTFCVARERRDLTRAREAFETILKAEPGLAEAYRGLAYVALSERFDVAQAEALYQKALQLRPDYGEVHYALAFLYAMNDRAKGTEHFKKAMALGIADEQGLARLFEE